MTDQRAHQPIEKQVAAAFPCHGCSAERAMKATGHPHWPGCPANHWPAVLALLERQEKEWREIATDLEAKRNVGCEDLQKRFNALERREQEHAEEGKVCAEVLSIMEVYHEQEKRGNIGTPGGLEHMGDVWSLLAKWERLLSKPPELGPCGRHGKEFWVAEAKYMPSLAFPEITEVFSLTGKGYCTACAQEKAAKEVKQLF